MRYPYERFLRYLVSRKVDVDETIGKYGLPSVGMLWESECRTAIRESAPYSVVSHIDSDEKRVLLTEGFLAWASREGILPFWRTQAEFGGGEPEPAFDAAIQIFVNPHARAMVGLLLLSEATDEEVIEFVNKRFELDVDDVAIGHYKSVFWDVTLLSRDDWQVFIGELEDPDEKHLVSLGLSSPSIADAKRFLSEAAGFSPDQVLHRILSKAHARFESAMEQPDPEASGAIRWAELAMRAISTLGTHKKAFGGDEAGELTPSEFQNMFSVTVEKIEHVSLSELQGEVAPKTDVPEVGSKQSLGEDA